MGLIVLVVAISLAPRIPLPIAIPERRFDLRVEDIILIILLLVWLLNLFLWPRIYRSPLIRIIVIYMAIIVFTSAISILVFSLSPARGFLYSLKELEFFLIFLLVLNWIRTVSDLKIVTGCLLLMGLVNAGWVAFQFLTQHTGQLLLLSPEFIPGRFQNPTLLQSYGPTLVGEASPLSTGGFFLIVTLLALSFWWHSKGSISRIPYLTLAITFLVALLLSQSRVTIVAALIGGVLLIILAKPLSVARLSGFLGLGLLSAVWLFTQVNPVVLQRFAAVNVLNSLSFRYHQIWQPLLERTYEGLLTGFGKGSLGLAPGLESSEAHNHYLRVLLESGLFGLIAFVWLLATIIFLSAKVYWSSKLPITKSISGAALGVTLGLSFGALFQDIFVPVLLNELWWILIGLTFAAYRIEKRSYNLEGNWTGAAEQDRASSHGRGPRQGWVVS